MKTLGIDTTTESGGVILGLDHAVVGMASLSNPRAYSDEIIPAISSLLKQSQWRLQDIDLIGVASGPGGFTGVRVGLSVVKAIGQSLKIRSVAISTLEALAYRFRQTHPLVAPMIDARREQVYTAVYRCLEGSSDCLCPEVVDAPASWLDSLPGDLSPVYVGTGAGAYREMIGRQRPGATICPSDNSILRPLFRLTVARSDRARSVNHLCANYVRPSDAEMGSRNPVCQDHTESP